MKVITEPTATVIAKQIFLGHPKYKIPADGSDAVKIGAFAAKGCYDSFSANGRANEENQRQILKHEHGSVLEHVNFTVFVEGITRGLSLESNRHRPLAVSQRSTRYTTEEDAAIVLEPYYAGLFLKHQPIDTKGPGGWQCPVKANKTSTEFIEKCLILQGFLNQAAYSIQQYKKQVENLEIVNPLNLTGFDLRKWARGKARSLLPHGLETRITYTGNIRAWRWFIESRSDKNAEPEIRRLANTLLITLRKEESLYFEDFQISEIYDGIPVWKPTYSKV